jgi:cytochrome c oxidase cbb3-type subunit I/II
VSGWRVLAGGPVVLSVITVLAGIALGVSSPNVSPLILTVIVMAIVAVIVWQHLWRNRGQSWHSLVEGKPLVFTFLVLVAILVGGVAEIIPTIVLRREIPLTTAAAAPAETPQTEAAPAAEESSFLRPAVRSDTKTAGAEGPAGFERSVDPKRVQQPYSPLELEGRDLYIREGCYVCHSQMIRPFRHETLRYGDYSRAEEYIYDRPFLWGSKRTGPDLFRVGGKLPNLWHYQHLLDPRSTSPGSLMPRYDWLKEGRVDYSKTGGKLAVMRRLGVPYTDEQIRSAESTALSQAALIRKDLEANAVQIADDSELIALIAYLQRLGRGPQPTSEAELAGAPAPADSRTVTPSRAAAEEEGR